MADRHHGLLDDGHAGSLSHPVKPVTAELSVDRLRELMKNLLYPELVPMDAGIGLVLKGAHEAIAGAKGQAVDLSKD
jgi:hypothetical protein